MIIEVFDNIFAFCLLIALYFKMALLELLVLRVVLTCNLLILLLDKFRLVTSILILQCLLVGEMLIDLSFDCSIINFSQQDNYSWGKHLIDSVTSLFTSHFCSMTCSLLKLGNLGKKLSVEKSTNFLIQLALLRLSTYWYSASNCYVSFGLVSEMPTLALAFWF